MGKMFFDWLNKTTDKILSARFLITVLFGVTYNHIVWHVVHSYLKEMSGKPELLGAFAEGVLAGFSGLAVLVVKSYFDRTDRPVTDQPNATIQTITTTDTTSVKPLDALKTTIPEVKP